MATPIVRRIVHITSIVALTIIAGSPAHSAGNRESGEALAHQWCSSCHAVEHHKAVITDRAPPFAAIALRRDDGWIKSWLSNPHKPMIGVELSRKQIEDVTAYIRSLK